MASSQTREAPPDGPPTEYDLIVIGGGSGGIATAKEAAALGAKVCILDYVDASPAGTRYALGGTCVNVGCIPKKLMHYVGLAGDALEDANEYGWKLTRQYNEPVDEYTPPTAVPLQHDWAVMKDLVQDYIGSLTNAYVSGFRKDPNTTYLNAKGYFVDAHTVHALNDLTRSRKVNQLIRAPHIVVAVGGRPSFPGVPGDKECCITSDDIFSLDRPPGKTLVVGASYIALECAGFLHGLGYPVSMMVRSVFLRGFDQGVATRIGDYMAASGVELLRGATPLRFERAQETGRVRVSYAQQGAEGALEAEYDTVLLAVGRHNVTPALELERAGVQLRADGAIACDDHQRSNVPHIYAIGDVLHAAPQLTPVAIKTGRLLARRLFGGAAQLMDFRYIPTTVFTPLEYGCIGLSEEAAQQQHGEEQVEVWHTNFEPLEWTPLRQTGRVAQRPRYACYLKLVCLISDNMRVVGFHYLGPNAGEITQGYATAMLLGATKADFDRTVGIHPTAAEQFTTLKITKRSGVELEVGGCAT